MDDETTDCLWTLATKLSYSSMRCRGIAESEHIMGYEESAYTYLAMAEEITAARLWVDGVLRRMVLSDA